MLEQFWFHWLSWRGRSSLRPYEKSGIVGAQDLAPVEASINEGFISQRF
jgi:hypothetical protein